MGAPPEMAAVLEEISNENKHIFVSGEIGTDPELDHFMVINFLGFFLFPISIQLHYIA